MYSLNSPGAKITRPLGLLGYSFLVVMDMREKYTEIGRLVIAGEILISDTCYFYDEPVIVTVVAGTYVVEVVIELIDNYERVVSARVRLEDTVGARAEKIGELIVDFAQVGFCNPAAMGHAFDLLGDDGMNAYYRQIDNVELYSMVTLLGDARMIVLRPGYGDGVYLIYELLSESGERVGVETVFFS